MTQAAVAAGWMAVVLLAGAARADDAPDAPASIDVTHPAYPADARWVRPTLVAIGGLFAAAAAVGGLGVWFRVRDMVPPASSHEEDPSADHH